MRDDEPINAGLTGGMPGVPAAALRGRLGAVQRSAGNRAATALVARRQQPVVQRDGGRPTVDPRLTNDPVGTAIAQAGQKYPQYADRLAQVRFRAVTKGDRTTVTITNGGSFVYPSAIAKADEGFYLMEWDAQGNQVPGGVINLETGQPPATAPIVRPLAGAAEVADLRKLRIGAIWITQTVTKPPPRHDPTPDELEIPLTDEISETELRRGIEMVGRRQLTIPGVTGGVFEPQHEYGKPLNFIFQTHDGMSVLVTRRLVGREFHYRLGIAKLQDYLRFYPFEYAGKSAAAWEPIYKLLFDVGVSFIPIIGPLYALGQAGYQGYQAYKNWDKMSGWEKGLVGVTILLSVVPVIRGGRNIVRGARAYNEGVGSLIAAGLPQKEASRLMIASGIFQSEKATLQIVDTLGDALRRGERLTATQLSQLEGVFGKMLQRLPTAERVAIEASFATTDIRAAREFLGGIELTEKHLTGLRRLTPEAMVALKAAAAKEPLLVQRAATLAASSQEIAEGINHLQAAVKSGQLATLINETGEDVLRRIGQAGGVPEKLAKFVGRARSASEAYRRLMSGSSRLKLPGLNEVLIKTETVPLSAELAAIRKQFGHTYLAPEQLHALNKLGATTRAALGKATDGQLRMITRAIDSSTDAVTGLEQLATQLGAAASERVLPGLVERVGGGVLEAAGANGVKISTELAAKVGATTGKYEAIDVLLNGFKIRRGPQVPGLLDEIAGKLPNTTSAEAAIAKIELPALRGEVFARWGLAHPDQVRAISPELADGIEAISVLRPATARKHIADLYRAFNGDQKVVNDFLETIGHLHKTQPGLAGLDRMVAELAAGGAKSMGASLTLQFAARRVAVVSAFEQEVTTALGTRYYDLVGDNLMFEFKYWRGFGGRPASQAAAEFAKDVVQHASENFGRLRWVIAKDALGSLPAIESMMRGVLTRREVRAELAKLGISVAEAQSRLDRALNSGLIQVF